MPHSSVNRQNKSPPILPSKRVTGTKPPPPSSPKPRALRVTAQPVSPKSVPSYAAQPMSPKSVPSCPNSSSQKVKSKPPPPTSPRPKSLVSSSTKPLTFPRFRKPPPPSSPKPIPSKSCLKITQPVSPRQKSRPPPPSSPKPITQHHNRQKPRTVPRSQTHNTPLSGKSTQPRSLPRPGNKVTHTDGPPPFFPRDLSSLVAAKAKALSESHSDHSLLTHTAPSAANGLQIPNTHSSMNSQADSSKAAAESSSSLTCGGAPGKSSSVGRSTATPTGRKMPLNPYASVSGVTKPLPPPTFEKSATVPSRPEMPKSPYRPSIVDIFRDPNPDGRTTPAVSVSCVFAVRQSTFPMVPKLHIHLHFLD